MNHAVKNLVIALSLIAAGFLIAWLRFRPHLETSGQFTDGRTEYSDVMGEPLRYALWEKATPVEGLHEDATAHGDPCLSADGRWMVVAVGERGFNVDLWMAPMQGDVPGPMRILHEINSDGDDLTPAFLNDTLYFASNREGGAGGFDLWRAEFVDGEFGLPERLPDSVNTQADESDPTLEPHHGALVFSSNRETEEGRQYDLYSTNVRGSGAFQVSPLTELNTPGHERDPAFTADGRTLFFASNRDDSQRYALFRTVLDRQTWLEPSPVRGLEMAGSLRGPEPTPDGFRLLFSADASEELPVRGIFEAPTRELFLRPGQPIGWFEILLLLALLLLALLAWLAKRWTTVEVIYRCFLVSLIFHALMMWWFQDVVPENPPIELAEASQTYQVRLAMDSAASRARQAERGGALQAERSSEALQQEQPQRAQLEAGETDPAPTPTVSTQTLALQTAPESAPTEDATAAQAQPQVNTSATSQLTLQDRNSPTPIYSGAAPTVTLPSAQAADSSQRAFRVAQTSERAALGTPSAAQRSASVPMRQGPAPRGVELAERAETSMPAEADSSVAVTVPSSPAVELEGVSQVANDAPSETFAASSAGNSGLALPQATGQFQRATPSSRSGAPQRLGQASAAGSALPSAQPSTPSPATPAALAGSATTQVPMDAPSPATFENPTQADSTRLDLADSTDSPSSPVAVEDTDPNAEDTAESGLAAKSFERARSRPALTPKRLAPARASDDRAQPSAAPTPTVIEPELAAIPFTPERQELPLQKTPYRNRFGLAKERALAELGGSAETEAAVASGLQYLARRQQRNGYWGVRSQNHEKYRKLRIGKTGLSVLAFLGANHTPSSNTEYSEVVEDAIRYLLIQQDSATGHFGDCSAYGHAVATYAIAECYALTKDERYLIPLKRAVAQILRNQMSRPSDIRFHGGWNYYYPDDETYDSWPRVSVTSWQVMALESARLGGIEVPKSALTDAHQFLLNAWDDNLGAFRYNHAPSRLRMEYATLPASTPAALFALSLLGEDLTDARFGQARAYMTERIPTEYRYRGEKAFVFRGTGNLYFWYYSSLALLRVGGSAWSEWNEGLKQTLLPSQNEDGSWEPISVYANYASDTDRDRVYTTAMCVLSLEVYYRYFTPLLRER